MNDAQSAIIDIQDALAEYGSNVTLNQITVGAYNPSTGETTNTTVSTALKAIIKKIASEDVLREYKEAYTYSLMLYHTSAIERLDTITIAGITYQVVFVSPMILQDIPIKYEVLVKS